MSTRRGLYTYRRNAAGKKYRVYKPVKARSGRYYGNKRKSYTGRDGDTIMGFGRYQKRSRTSVIGRPAKIVNFKDGRVLVRHQEYLGNILSSTGYLQNTLPLNPGMQRTFPWLSRIAQNFEEWIPRGIFFEFRTTSSDALVTTASTPSLGQIMMATQYNALDNDFTSESQLLNYENAVSTKPSGQLRHYIECKRNSMPINELYIRTGEPPQGADLRLYDIGKTSLGTSGMQVTGQIMGQIWISYEIELKKPKIPQDPITQTDVYYLTDIGVSGETPQRPFGTNVNAVFRPQPGSSGFTAIAATASAGRISFSQKAAGKYLIWWGSTWNTPGTNGSLSFANLVGCQVVDTFGALDANQYGQSSGVTDDTRSINASFIVNVTGSPASLDFNSTSTCTGDYNTNYGSYLMITEIPDNIIFS